MPVLYGIACEFLIVLLCWSNFYKTPYTQSKEKSGWFCMTTWSFSNLIAFTWFSEICVVNYYIFAIESIIFCSVYLYSQFRSYEVIGSRYESNKTYIVFKKPKNFFDYIHSFVFRPVSSVSVMCNGWWYGYTLGYPYHCEMYDYESHDDILIEISYLTESFVQDKLEPLIGSRWSPLNNCCHTIQRLFPFLKFTLLDSLPSHLIKTIRKERAKECLPQTKIKEIK